MPKSDDERAKMRADALRELRSMRDEWQQSVKTSPHGDDLLISTTHQERYNESVHKLAIAIGDLDARHFETSRPFPKNKKQGRPIDMIPITFLLGKVRDLLLVVDSEQEQAAE
jgi:hypothetical protein